MSFIFLKDQRTKILKFLVLTENYACDTYEKTKDCNCTLESKSQCNFCEISQRITEDILEIYKIAGISWCEHCGKNKLKEDLFCDDWENYWCKDKESCKDTNPGNKYIKG